jgi:3-methyladenine DNA glycosylase/8-oxoguanine DNA glycosylase
MGDWRNELRTGTPLLYHRHLEQKRCFLHCVNPSTIHPMRLVLTALAPFRLDTTVVSHGWYQLAPLQWDGTRLLRPERLDDGRVLPLTITAAPNGIAVETPGALDGATGQHLTKRLRWMFALDADLTSFYTIADGEPRLQHVRKQAGGRMLRSTSLFEDVVKMMLTTNIQWSGTRRLSQALVTRFGDAGAFPTAERIARTRESTLRSLGLGYRAPYLLQLARAVASGRTDLDTLRDPMLPTLALRQQLLALPGIGPYAAAGLLALLGRGDFIPVDTVAVAAVSKHFFAGRKIGEKEINAVFARFGEHKALAYWFWDYDS